MWEESYWLPQVAVGARDIGGTGLFDAEYLVASKAWWPFDFTLGLGWGYLGTSGNVKNPLCSASDKYCYRDNSYKQAGSIDGSQMFHGFGLTVWRRGIPDALATAAPETGV